MTVLVVDDHPLLAEFLSRLLAARGHRPILRDHPREALAFLEEHSVDFLLTDLWMPQMNGLALAAAARAVRPSLEVILLTGDPSPGVETMAAKVGIYKVLPSR